MFEEFSREIKLPREKCFCLHIKLKLGMQFNSLNSQGKFLAASDSLDMDVYCVLPLCSFTI